MSPGGVLVLGREHAALRGISDALGGRLEALPDSCDDAALEAWRARVADGPACEQIVVAVWSDPERAELLELGPDAWLRRAEQPFLGWCVALGAASARCADGGAIVAVAEAPAALDSAGWSPETGLADAVGALVRSLSQSEGPRGVRVNAVTSPARPDRLDAEIAGAVRLLLSPLAAGLTGRSLAADRGRSW